MNLWHLKYFYEAAKTQSLKKAADKYLVSSSAISQAIKALESEFETNLLIHKKRNFELSPAGTQFFKKIPDLINHIQSVTEDLKNIDQSPQGTIRVGVPRSLLNIKLIQSLMILKKAYPQLKYKIQGGITSEIKKWVELGDVDFGFIIDDENLKSFHSEEFLTGNFILIGKNKTKNTLDKKLVVTDQNKIEVQYLLNQIQNKYKKQILPELEISSWSVITELCKKAEYIGYVPDFVAQEDLKKERLVKIQMEGLKTYSYSAKAIWNKSKSQPQTLKLLLELLKKSI